MPTCGDKGFTTKSGKPCGYNIPDGEEACPHHAADTSRARSFQRRGGLMSQRKQLPDWIETADFQTTADTKRTIAAVVRELATNEKADLRRCDSIIRACTAVGTIQQIEKTEELLDVLRTVEGQGKAVIVYNNMKQSRRRPLPVPQDLHLVRPERAG